MRDQLQRSLKLRLGKAIVLGFLLLGLVAPSITPHDPNFQSRRDRGNGGVSLPPAWDIGGNNQYLLGTDRLGRDIFARLLYGTRNSLLIGVIPAVLTICIGVTVGVMAGYLRGSTETILMRITDIMIAFPNILLLLILVAILRDTQIGPFQIGTTIVARFYIIDIFDGIPLMILALTITSWGETARIIRSQTIILRESGFVLSTIAIGAPRTYIIWTCLIKNLMPLILLEIMLAIPRFILNEAFLGFIGLGIRPPNPSWGSLLNDGYRSIQQLPQLVWAPIFCITLIVIAFSLLSE